MADEDLEDDSSNAAKTVRYDRFQQVVQARNELRTKATQLEGQVQTLTEKAATADTLATQLEAAKAELASQAASWAEERGLLQAGLTDPDDVDLAKLFYNKTPKEGRKPLGEWWGGLKADPTKAPRQLQPLLGAANAEKKETAPDRGNAAPGNASTTTGMKAGTQPAGGDPISAEKIREIRDRAMKTGDWSEWKKVREQLG